MRFTTSAVARAPVEEVWAWWTDYGDAGTEAVVSHGYGRTRRRVTENDGKRVVLVEESPPFLGRAVRLLEHEVTLNDGYWLDEKATGRTPFESKWFFEALPGDAGTRITREVHLKHDVADFLEPVAAPVAKRLVAKDLEHHVAEFERERGAST